MIAVDITLPSEFTAPARLLFAGPFEKSGTQMNRVTMTSLAAGTHLGPYEISPRFLFLTPAGETASSPLTVVVNWAAELKR